MISDGHDRRLVCAGCVTGTHWFLLFGAEPDKRWRWNIFQPHRWEDHPLVFSLLCPVFRKTVRLYSVKLINDAVRTVFKKSMFRGILILLDLQVFGHEEGCKTQISLILYFHLREGASCANSEKNSMLLKTVRKKFLVQRAS